MIYLKKTRFNIFSLTDQALDEFIESVHTNFEERMKVQLKYAGVVIDSYDITKENDFKKDLQYVWEIARGNKDYISHTEDRTAFLRKKDKVYSIEKEYLDMLNYGNIIPTVIEDAYAARYKWGTIVEFAIHVAKARIEMMLGEMINVSDATILGGYKSRGSVMFWIRNGDLRFVKRELRDQIDIDGEQFMNILLNKRRLYWHTLKEIPQED